MASTAAESRCPFCGAVPTEVDEQARCERCQVIIAGDDACPICGGDVRVRNHLPSCEECGYQRRFPAD